MSINLLLIFFVLIVVAMIAFILVQKGAGATAGSAFGSGASSTVFGAKGSGNFLTKTTMVLAFLFFAISLYMAVQASKEFTTATTGEVDLGVVGKLNTSDTDVPEITPAAGDTTPESDIPNVDIKTTPVESTATDIPAAIENEAETAKDAVEQKAEEIKTDIKEAVKEKAEEIKEPIEG